MSETVKPKRKYQSPRREAQAEETREAVLGAARHAFSTNGWAGTTIPAIASAAGVSNETIYSAFGSKQAVLMKLIERAVRGEASDLPLLEQTETRNVLDKPGGEEIVDAFSTHIAGILERVAPLIGVVRTAAETNPELSELYQTLHAGRRRNLAAVASALARGGYLRAGIEAEQAADEIWRLASPELFLLLRHVEGLSVESYAAWLRDRISHFLLSH
jgi:AcrR family transcriptional regulator